MVSPVAGFLPSLPALVMISREPNPGMVTFSPFLRASVIAKKKNKETAEEDQSGPSEKKDGPGPEAEGTDDKKEG